MLNTYKKTLALGAVVLASAATLQANEGLQVGLNLGGNLLSGKHTAREESEVYEAVVVADNKKSSKFGFLTEGRLAYLFDTKGRILVGPEAFLGYAPNSLKEEKDAYTSAGETSGFAGAGVLVGFKMDEGLMPYVRVGFEAMRMKQTWNEKPDAVDEQAVNKTKKHVLPGVRLGLGVQKMWGQWGVNAGYDFSMYKTAKASYDVTNQTGEKSTVTQAIKSPKVHKVSLGLVYRF